MSTIRRVNRPADQFTMISNGFVRDARLSLKARGLGAWLLSHTDGWETNVSRIASMVGAGREQVRTALLELERFGYLRRTQERAHDGRVGESVYLIQCTPFEPETPGQDRNPETRPRETRRREPGQHKNTSSRRETTSPQKNTPSGGSPADAGSGHPDQDATEDDQAPIQDEPARSQEDPVAPAPTLALFDAPAQPDKPRDPSAATVTAAYVDAFRLHHDGQDPLKRDTGRVARDAAAMLRRQEATVEELTAAARAMGSGPYSNLGVQLRMYRDRQRPRRSADGGRGIVPPTAHGHPGWEAGAAQTAADVADLIAQDPELAAWLAGEVA